jgi:SanA protein
MGSIILLLTFSYLFVFFKAKSKVYHTLAKIPYHDTTLLLGTSKYMDNGKVNLFFTYRCRAAVELWNKNKTRFFIISGDSTSPDYDEPLLMKKELIKSGVPDSIILLDKRGVNTRASLLFCKSKNIKNLTIVSQQFHNERAIVIAENLGIKAVGYDAKPVYTTYGIKVLIREWFARVKLILELIIQKPYQVYS